MKIVAGWKKGENLGGPGGGEVPVEEVRAEERRGPGEGGPGEGEVFKAQAK